MTERILGMAVGVLITIGICLLGDLVHWLQRKR